MMRFLFCPSLHTVLSLESLELFVVLWAEGSDFIYFVVHGFDSLQYYWSLICIKLMWFICLCILNRQTDSCCELNNSKIILNNESRQ